MTASFTLGMEAHTNSAEYHEPMTGLPLGLTCGTVLGLGFILLTQGFLEEHEHLKFEGLEGLNAKKSLLIMGVMTLHSFTEGVREDRTAVAVTDADFRADRHRGVVWERSLTVAGPPHFGDISGP